MQVNMLRLFELAPTSQAVPNPPEQEEKVSRFVDEHFESLKQEAGVMTETQRSWALTHLNQLPQNEKIEELAQILQGTPEQLAPTKNTAEVRSALDRALLVEGLDRWVADPNATGNKEEARSRILRAFDEHSNILDLNWLELNSLPPEIGLLAQLQALALDCNQLTALPPEIGQLAQLEELHLSGNLLTALPAGIVQLTQLKWLDLGHNQLTVLSPDIGQLAQLEELHLSSNLLTALPAEIVQLTQLQLLDLSSNQLTALPAEIVQLRGLQTLAIAYNPDLAELPLSLGTILGITTLDISGTQIPRRVTDALLASTRALRDQQALVDLPRRLGVWKAAFGTDAPALAHIEGLEDREKYSINEWLTRLERCRDFSGNQKEMARIVLGILESLKDHPEFKEQFFEQVEANLERCEDRAAMSLNEIYTAHLITTTESPALETLVGVARTFALRKAVMGALAGTEGQAESVETYLRYESALRDSLGLVTAIKSGRFTGMGRNLDEKALIAAVENSYLEELIELPIFLSVAMKDPDYEIKHRQINADFLETLEKLSGDLSTQEYKSQNEQLTHQRNQLIRNLQLEWLQTQGIPPSR